MKHEIEQVKGIITDYLGKAQAAAAKYEEGRTIYQEEALKKEYDRLRGDLMKSRKQAEDRIEQIYQTGAKSARTWGDLDGTKLTADAQLLHGEGVTPEQFKQLVTRYQDNYTMLDQLRKFGEARNKDEVRKAHESGNHGITAGPYNVQDIPGPDAKLHEWDALRKKAEYFLNVADGTGMDDFTLNFARASADKDFEAWGSDSPAAEKDVNAVSTLLEGWGFNKAR